MHMNYQIDGNTNTQKDRAGLRLLPMSEVVVREVKVVTIGLRARVRPDDGHGLQRRHAVGHQRRAGLLSYRFRRAGMTERPFFLSPDRAQARQQRRQLHRHPRRADRARTSWHYYLGYEYVDQDLRDASKVIQQSAVDNAQALGLSATAIPADGVIPTKQHVNFAIAKTDYQLSPEHKLSARYFFFKNKSPYNIGGGAQHRRARHRLQRPDGLGVGPARSRRSARTG